jgi:hypothetical protein
MLSDSTNGYVSKFKPYTGKSATGPSMNGATYDLVMNLMRGLLRVADVSDPCTVESMKTGFLSRNLMHSIGLLFMIAKSPRFVRDFVLISYGIPQRFERTVPGFFEKGCNLYCDNYYTSPQLFWDLFQLGVNATGTVRSNRCGIP